MRVRGSAVVVTGASSGIGAATAVAMARSGARAVALVARSAAALDEVAARVRAAGAEALPIPADLSDAAAVDRARDAVLAFAGAPDVLVNNAGAGRFLLLTETDPAEALRMIAVPYLAAFHATRAFLPAMIERRSGHVLNVTSPAAFAPWAGATGYAAARWAVRGLTEALRADLHGTGVGVTLFTAGKVASSYWEHNPGAEARLPGVARLYRTLSPDEVGAAIVRAVERGAREAVVPPLLRLTLLAHRLFPRTVSSLVVRTSVRRYPAR
jgi:short-subunit dehydrogenase